MKAILIDDERIMLQRFSRISSEINDLTIAGLYDDPEEALRFFSTSDADIAFIDIEMPVMNGIELAVKLRKIKPDINIIFITSYEKYIRDFNEIGGDYYIIKPYKKETIEMAVSKLKKTRKPEKNIYIQMFGTFNIINNGKPVKIRGKAKEILALVVSRKGKLISNKEIYHTIWEDRFYSNRNMTVYYNALRRLKNTLKKENIESILLYNHIGLMANTALFECDYYTWNADRKNCSFEGELLTEYSWSETILADMIWKEIKK